MHALQRAAALSVFTLATLTSAQIRREPAPPRPDHTVATSADAKYSLKYLSKENIYVLMSGETKLWSAPRNELRVSRLTIVGDDGRCLMAFGEGLLIKNPKGETETAPQAWKVLGHKDNQRFVDLSTDVLVPRWQHDVAVVPFTHENTSFYSVRFRWGERLIVNAADLSIAPPTQAQKQAIADAEENWAASTLGQCVTLVGTMVEARTDKIKAAVDKLTAANSQVELTSAEAGEVVENLTVASLILGERSSKRCIADLRTAERWTGWISTTGATRAASEPCDTRSVIGHLMRLPVHYALLRAGESPLFAGYECPCWRDAPVRVKPQSGAKQREQAIRALEPGVDAAEIQTRCGGPGLIRDGVWFYDIAGEAQVTVEIRFENGQSASIITHEGGLWSGEDASQRYLD